MLATTVRRLADCEHCWAQTEAQQHSRLVGMCLLTLLQEFQHPAFLTAASPDERRARLKQVQVTAMRLSRLLTARPCLTHCSRLVC